MISQWWALMPPAIFAVGGVLYDLGHVYSRRLTYPGLAVSALSGLAWLAYGILRDEVTIWVVGAMLAATYCEKIVALARTRDDDKLAEEDNV